MRRLSLVLLLATLVGTTVSHAARPAERWWAHVQFLADDALEGRDTGSPGISEYETLAAISIFSTNPPNPEPSTRPKCGRSVCHDIRPA